MRSTSSCSWSRPIPTYHATGASPHVLHRWAAASSNLPARPTSDLGWRYRLVTQRGKDKRGRPSPAACGLRVALQRDVQALARDQLQDLERAVVDAEQEPVVDA